MGGATMIGPTGSARLRRGLVTDVRATISGRRGRDAADASQAVQHTGYSKTGASGSTKAHVMRRAGHRAHRRDRWRHDAARSDAAVSGDAALALHQRRGTDVRVVDPESRFGDAGHRRDAPRRHEDAGRLPLELVDTGHVGLAQRTRRGDSVRAWYRGPFVPHPTDDAPAQRLPLAHAADQLRIVIPDGREDLSLASAFEIGRLLALANPNMVAALLRWRQLHYATVRRTTIWKANAALLGAHRWLCDHRSRHCAGRRTLAAR